VKNTHAANKLQILFPKKQRKKKGGGFCKSKWGMRWGSYKLNMDFYCWDEQIFDVTKWEELMILKYNCATQSGFSQDLMKVQSMHIKKFNLQSDKCETYYH